MVPKNPKIFHIVHWNKLAAIINDRHLWSDAVISARDTIGTSVGMRNIKQRRLTLLLKSHPNLTVGECVPFYFCPRSIMLHSIHVRNIALDYKGGQEPIVHLVMDFHKAIEYATEQQLRWAFTSSNAGSFYFQDFNDLSKLNQINWTAVHARRWSGDGIDPLIKESKQAEFLIEQKFPWDLIESIAVYSNETLVQVNAILKNSTHKPQVEIKKIWYY